MTFPRTALAAASALLLVAGTAQATGADVSVGSNYSSGTYGGDITTGIWSVPLGIGYRAGNWSFRASVPWVRIDGASNVVPGAGPLLNLNPNRRGPIILPPGQQEPEVVRSRASGLGDAVLSASWAALQTEGGFGLDVGARVKLPTADEDKGLGTGATDYGVSLDVFQSLDALTLFGGVSYTDYGSTEFIQLDNALGANAGFSYAFTPRSSGGLMLDYRERISRNGAAQNELTGFYNIRMGANSRVQLHALRGLADGSPDWGAGVSLRTGF